MKKDLPVFELRISDKLTDDSEVNFVALVDRPAIQRDFLTFNETTRFAVEDEEQHIVTGPAMIPDSLIYRNDTKGEYYVVFGAETINQIAHKFFQKGYQANINIMHKQDAVVSDSVFYESWLVDREKGKMPLKGFEDLPDGTWFLTAKINNEDTWQKIKSGEYKGFSVEGLFDYSPTDNVSPEQELLNQIVDILNSINV